MTSQQRNSIAYATASVGTATPWGPAEPFCLADALTGKWACASHGVESFTDRFAFIAHIDEREDPCVIVWRCSLCERVHGVRR